MISVAVSIVILKVRPEIGKKCLELVKPFPPFNNEKVVLLNGLHWCISWRWGCSSHWGHRWGGGRSVASASWDRRPLKRRSRHDHVSDQGFDGSFANQSDKKELLNHLRWHCPQWGESQKKPAKSCRLIGILGATVFFECTLRLFLHLLYDLDVGQPWCICNGNGNWEGAKLKEASTLGNTIWKL